MDFKSIEEKWRKRWRETKIFEVKEKGKKYYILEMYPYPSGLAGHVGHARNYVIGDSFVRFMRMLGYNVLYPMGWDAFGLPSENAAIEMGIHPTKSVAQNIKTFKEQLNALSLSYDWTREITTCDPEYYKWTQWIFLKLFKNGLAYKKFAPGNWCPSCKTVLANEDVKEGKCWRCGTEVIQKEINQWFFKITEYADRLLKDLEKIKWSERLKTMQRNWIGKSKGIEIYFKESETNEILPAFTTRPDTIYSCTFLVMAPEHPKVKEFVKGTKYEKEVEKFLEKTSKLTQLERISKEKDGLFIGRYVINPANDEKIPIYIANFVVMGYGTGIVLADAHDQRDFEFARKYNIPLKFVISKDGKPTDAEKATKAYTDDGILFDSGKFSGMNNRESIPLIIDWLVKEGNGKIVTYYKIRDWCISRQRYWGAPIPVVYCKKCGIVPVPEKNLPVILPLDVKFGKKGAPPLATNKDFVNIKCPKCKSPAKRETDTMTTFVDSSWYFLRYTSPKYDKAIFDKEKVKYWLPVDQYIGGIEHAVGHLMYSRFITKFLKDKKYLDFDEPFLRLLNQGIVKKGGVIMSKSKGNIVDPRDVVKKHGVDALRTYLLFMAHPSKDVEWTDKEMGGISRFLEKVRKMIESVRDVKGDKYIESVTQRKIKSITKAMKNLEQNIVIIELMDFANEISKHPSLYAYKILLKMLTPFAPHTTEELWETLGEKEMISVQNWPEPDESKINLKVEAAEKFISQVIKDIKEIKKLSKIKKPVKITIFTTPSWKYEVYNIVLQEIELKELMTKDEFKKIGKLVTNYYNKLQKKKPLEELFLTTRYEYEVLEKEKESLEKELKCKIEIIKAEDSKHPKALAAEPFKPGILIE